MRPIERIFVFGGIAAAIIIGLSSREASGIAIARTPQAAGVKIGIVDVYIVAERLMAAPELKKIREDAVAGWQTKADRIEKDLADLDKDLSVLPQNDPKVQELLKQAQGKQQDYQKLLQDRQADLEKINASQLIEGYLKVRTAVEAVAAKLEYSHVFANREYDRAITTTNLSQTLQELLARPLVSYNRADDLTKQVMAELKIEP